MGGATVQAVGVGARPPSQGLLTYRERATPMAIGATPAQWARFVDAGLTADLLPVVSDRTIPIHPESKLRELGKTPAAWSGWVRCRYPQVDGSADQRAPGAAGPPTSASGSASRPAACGPSTSTCPTRPRVGALARSSRACSARCRCAASNSGKQLIAFVLEGDYTKRIIKSVDGPIEFLATGQQFIAGAHTPAACPTSGGGLEVLDVLGDFPRQGRGVRRPWAMLAELHGKSIEVQEGMRPVEIRTAAAMRDDVVSYPTSMGGCVTGRRMVRSTCAAPGRMATAATAARPSRPGSRRRGVSTPGTQVPACVLRAPYRRRLPARRGWVENQFEPIPDHVVARDEVKRKGVPGAHHLTTDQANAVRIMRAFGKRLIVVADTWYVWTGKRWERDMSEGLPLRMPAVHAPARGGQGLARCRRRRRRRPTNITRSPTRSSSGPPRARCSSIDAAVGLAKRMLAVDEAAVDRDPWLLNCANGTVDLRTGEIKPHDPDDYITKLCPVPYDPDARSEVGAGHRQGDAGDRTAHQAPGLVPAALVRLLRHRQHARAVLHRALWLRLQRQEHDPRHGRRRPRRLRAGTAAPGLLVGSFGERHPTELADLFGRRMVTAHETGDGGHLREDVVKQITARTRSRRATCVPTSSSSSPPTRSSSSRTTSRSSRAPTRDLAARDAHALSGALCLARGCQCWACALREGHDHRRAPKAELPGVPAWVVRGAREWFAEGSGARCRASGVEGLPVRAGPRRAVYCRKLRDWGPAQRGAYRQFQRGLYPAYREWCVEGGYHALSKQRFLQEIERCVPGFRKEDSYPRDEGGKNANFC